MLTLQRDLGQWTSDLATFKLQNFILVPLSLSFLILHCAVVARIVVGERG